MNVFEAVKQNVTTRQAAELYGIPVSRNGMAVCPFHNDKNPSMKLDRRFHCFGCQADGDAVDFVSRLFQLPSKEAAMKIADDFGIAYDNRQKPTVKPHIREPTPEQKYRQEEMHCYKVLCEYSHLLQKWEQQYAPPVNLNVIADVKKAVSVPVVGNGDIFSAKDAANMFEQTGCDMVMVGRGAMGAPWIFRQINTYLSEGKMLPDPPISRKMELMLRQARLMCEYKDPRTALLQMRKHAAWYIKGMKGAAELRKRAFKITDISELERLAYDIVKEEKESVL